MSFIGTIQTGPNADAYREQAPAIVSVSAGAVINTGTPLRRSVVQIQGQQPSAYPFSAITPGMTQGDINTQLTATGAGFCYGVFNGPTFSNASQVGATSMVTPYVTRTGITPLLVGVTSGGTAVTVGAVVGMNSLQAQGLVATNALVSNNQAGGANFATVVVQPTTVVGSALGTVVGYPIVTNLVSTQVAGAAVTIPVGSVIGFSSTQALTINPGLGNAETVTPTSFTVGTVAALGISFASTSAGSPSFSLVLGTSVGTSTGAPVPGIVGGVVSLGPVTFASGLTGVQAASVAAVSLQQLFQTQLGILGIAPTNIPGVQGIQPFSLFPTSATSVVTIAAAIPSPAYNAIGVSVVQTAAISIVIGPSSLAGTSVGAFPVMIATLANNHGANEPVVGLVQTYGATIAPVPPAGCTNVALCMVDLTGMK